MVTITTTTTKTSETIFFGGGWRGSVFLVQFSNGFFRGLFCEHRKHDLNKIYLKFVIFEIMFQIISKNLLMSK